MALRYLYGSATQGGADAFVQAEVATALSGQTRRAYRVRELFFEIPRVGAPVNGANVVASLTRRTKAAIPLISDVDVIAKVMHDVGFVTSGTFVYNPMNRLTFSEDDELLIVEDPVYLQFDSNATTLTQTCTLRIGYEEVNISEVDRLTLLTQSLQ